jgi:hypothetical protein
MIGYFLLKYLELILATMYEVIQWADHQDTNDRVFLIMTDGFTSNSMRRVQSRLLSQSQCMRDVRQRCVAQRHLCFESRGSGRCLNVNEVINLGIVRLDILVLCIQARLHSITMWKTGHALESFELLRVVYESLYRP